MMDQQSSSNKQPRVAILKSSLEARGGLEKYALRLAFAFRKQGADVHLLTSGQTLEGTSLCSNSGLSLSHLKRFNLACNEWLLKNPMDIIFGLDRNPNVTHFRAGNGCHAAFLESRHSNSLKRLTFALNPLHRTILSCEKKLFENPHLQTLFVNSKMVREEILQRYDIREDKISVVHNGVEWEEFEAPFEATFSHKRDEKSISLLFAGHGFARKGLDLLLNALKRHPHFHLTVVGKDRNLTYFQKIAAPLKERVRFIGAAPSLLPFYQTSDALILPSLYDPFANVTIEALAMGLFVVTSKYNGGGEVLQEKTGCIIDDLFDDHAFDVALSKIQKKTLQSASMIRLSVQHLDFSKQLQKIVQPCLASVISPKPL